MKSIARIPRAEYGSLVAVRQLVESWKVDAVTHLVEGCADSEPIPVSEDERASPRIGPGSVLERQRSILNLEAHRHWAPRVTYSMARSARPVPAMPPSVPTPNAPDAAPLKTTSWSVNSATS